MNQLAGLRELVGEMYAGTVEFLLILGGNPVYTAPADLNFAAAMERVPLRAHLGLYEDETSALCHWHIPETHFLEAWSDVRSDDGTATIIQPLIAPLYSGKSAHEVVAAIDAIGERPGYEVVREYWSRETGLSMQAPPAPPAPPRRCGGARGAGRGPARRPGGRRAAATAPPPIAAAPVPPLSPFDREWRKWLHDGLIPNTAFAPRTVAVQGDAARRAGRPQPRRGSKSVFRPDPGRPRRPLRQQRLAAGAAEAADEADLGQRRADRRPATAARLALDQRRRRRAAAGRSHDPHPGLARAGPCARYADAASRLRPHARRPRRQRHRLQRQPAADDRPRWTR